MLMTKEQRRERAKSLGASEIPKIMGFDGHDGPFKVWKSKLYPDDCEDQETPQQSRGHFAEPMIAQCYQRDTGREAFVCQHQKIHPQLAWLTCTPDYLTSPAALRNIDQGLECKTTGQLLDARYCPYTYEYQARTQLACQPGLQAVVIAAFDPWAFIDGTPIYWEIRPDPEKEQAILEAAKRFWYDHVMGRKEPGPDHTKEYARWRDARPSQGLTLTLPEVPETEEQRELLNVISAYRDVSDIITSHQRKKALVLNDLRLRFEKYDAVYGPFGSFHYKAYKESREVIWENVARYLGAQCKVSQEDFDAMVLIHTKITPGGRHPMPHWKKERKHQNLSAPAGVPPHD